MVAFQDNVHQFKADQEYGAILTRIWFRDPTIEYYKQLNTCVVGRNGLKLLPNFVVSDIGFTCPTKKEKNTILAFHFKQYLKEV